MAGTPIEIAFEEVAPFAATEEDYDEADMNVGDMLEEEMYYQSIESDADEIERWNGVRIDDDLYSDPDNAGFEQYDNESNLDF